MMNSLAALIILAAVGLSSVLFAQPQPYPGWPPKAITRNHSWSPELLNLDTLPDLEFMAGIDRESLYVWKLDGSNLSFWPKPLDPSYVSWGRIAAVGDVDGDRRIEIVISSSLPAFFEPTRLYIFRANGHRLTGWPLEFPIWGDAIPVLADLNFDGKLEIIFTFHGDSLVYVYDYAGNPYPGWPQKIIYEPQWGRIHNLSPAVGDIDGDGSLEIVAFAWDNLYAWHSDGTLLPGFPVPPPEGFFYDANPVLADMEGDGKLEIAVIGHEPVLPDLRGFLTVIDYQGQVRVGFPRIFDDILYPAPCIGDLDKDGYKEIVVEGPGHSHFPQILNLYLIRYDGTDYAGWPIWAPGPSANQNVLADLDGDGWTDILNMYDTCYGGYCYQGYSAYKLNGERVEGYPLMVSGSTGGFTPSFADVDFDDTSDMAFISDKAYLYRLSGVPYDPSTLLWPQFGHDDYNTNNAEFEISYKVGDPNADGQIDIIDVVYLVNFVFKRRLHPNPLWNSDVNCSGQVNLGDIMYLANYVFKIGSPAPCQ